MKPNHHADLLHQEFTADRVKRLLGDIAFLEQHIALLVLSGVMNGRSHSIDRSPLRGNTCLLDEGETSDASE